MQKSKLIKKAFLCFLMVVLLLVSGMFKEGAISIPEGNAISSTKPFTQLNISPITGNNYVSKYVPFKTFTQDSANSNYNIGNSIIVIEDALDLYSLSIACNASNKDRYLNKHYCLGGNINYDEMSQLRQFFKPIGAGTTGSDEGAFTGIFDGQGYTISNLFMSPIENISEYPDLYSLAMFGHVGTTGVVKNIGLIDIIYIQSSIFEEITHAAALIGCNDGLVEYTYVIDDRESSGYSIEGVFLSGLMCANYGTFRESYVATTSVISDSVTFTEGVRPVLTLNEGTVENVYYDSSIYQNNYTETVSGIQGVSTIILADASCFTYSESDERRWYSRSAYNESLNVTLSNTYPILHGFEIDSSNRLIINSAETLAYMFALASTNYVFRQAKYIVTECIDMSAVSYTTYHTLDLVFNGTIESAPVVSGDDCSGSSNGGSVGEYHTIYNFKVSSSLNNGIYTVYSMFTSLGSNGNDIGTLRNLNFVGTEIIPNDVVDASSTNSVYSMLVGVLDNGVIDNVHVYGTVDLSNITTLGYTDLGGLVGRGKGTITSSTVSGVITGGIHTYNSNIMNNRIGGIIGEGTDISIINSISNVDITGIGFLESTTTAASLYIGGVVGKGNVSKLTNVINQGNITSHALGSHITKVYIGGIESIIEGISTSYQGIEKVYNSGNISLTLSSIVDANIAGVATIKDVVQINDGDLEYISLNNGGTIYTASAASLSTDDIAECDIKVAGVVITENAGVTLNGIYNYADFNIDLTLIPGFAACINNKLDSTVNGVDLTLENSTEQLYIYNSYNYGNITTLTTNSIVWYQMWTSGNVLGRNIKLYKNIRNEGNINISITEACTITNIRVSGGGTTAVYKHYKIFGCLEEVSQDCTAENCYNGGDIQVLNIASNVVFCFYISGIAYKNANTNLVGSHYTEIEVIEANGSMHNCVNDGNITVLGGSIFGQSRVSGIVSVNAGLISSCFNTGDMYNSNSVPAASNYSSSEFEVETGGITFLMNGQYAQIKDSANYGTIISVDPGNNRGWVNAGGIAVRNEKHENGTDYGSSSTAGSHYGKIEFTINYGDVYSWNGRDTQNGNLLTSNSEPKSKAAGMLCLGVLSVVNCINYGNIYGKFVASGIFGYIYGLKFSVTNNSVYVANSINYGNIRRITSVEAITSLVAGQSNSSYITTTKSELYTSSRRYQIGAFIGNIRPSSTSSWDLGSDTTFLNINYSYLINFDEVVDMIGFNTQATVLEDTIENATAIGKISNMVNYMATISPDDTSTYPFTEIASYDYDTYEADDLEHNDGIAGIFSPSFPLRNQPDDPNFYDIKTNRYIYEYIQFIPYSKVSSVLANKTGLTSLVTSSYSDDPDQIGIYALSSSLGIENGLFIPENVDLEALDPVTEDGTTDSSWRGGTDNNTLGTINNKFFVQMKQLKKSIATAVYNIELVTVDDPTMYLTEPVIDITNHIITFYVPDDADEANNYIDGAVNSNGTYTPVMVDPEETPELSYVFSNSEGYSVTVVLHYDRTGDVNNTYYTIEYDDDTYRYNYDASTGSYISTDPSSIIDLEFSTALSTVMNFTDSLEVGYSNDINDYYDGINAKWVYDYDSDTWVFTAPYSDDSGTEVGYYSSNARYNLDKSMFTETVSPTVSGYIRGTSQNTYGGSTYPYIYSDNITEDLYYTIDTLNSQTFSTVTSNSYLTRYYHLYAYCTLTATGRNAYLYIGYFSRNNFPAYSNFTTLVISRNSGITQNDFTISRSSYYYLSGNPATEDIPLSSGYICEEIINPNNNETFDLFLYSTNIRPGSTYYSLTTTPTEEKSGYGAYYYSNGAYYYSAPSGGTYVHPREATEVNYYKPTQLTVHTNSPNETATYKVNLDNVTYSLSYGASLYPDGEEDTSKILGEINVPRDIGEDKKTSSIIRIYSEAYSGDDLDKVTYDDYTIHIVRTASQGLTIDDLKVNDVSSTYSTTTVEDSKLYIAANRATYRDGSIEVSYITNGLSDYLDLSSKINLYYQDPLGEYTFNDESYSLVTSNYTLMGGICYVGSDYFDPVTEITTRIPNYDSATCTWGEGAMSYSISFDLDLASGTYLSVVELSENKYYGVIFNKAESEEASVLSMTYGLNEFTNPTGAVNTFTSTVPFGRFSDISINNFSNFTNCNIYYNELSGDNLPSILNSLVISPYAHLTNISFTSTLDSSTNTHTFTFNYTITAQAGNTSVFTHVITELVPDTTLHNIYKNGLIQQDEDLTTSEVFDLSVEREDTATIYVEYDFSNYGFSDENAFGVNLSSINSNVINYTYSTTGSLEIYIEESVAVDTYTVTPVYNTTQTINGESISWELSFNSLSIEKLPSKQSALSNVSFISDTVYSGLNTMIDTKEMTIDDYSSNIENNLSDLTVVVLPSGIYYNEAKGASVYYVIGQVLKTNLDFYSPTFTLPNNESKIYRIVTEDEVITDSSDEVVQLDFTTYDYYIDTLGTVHQTSKGGVVLTETTYTGIWRFDFTSLLSMDGTTLNYLKYRVYAEDANYYTDYFISIQDVFNNVKFNISVVLDSSVGEALNNSKIYLEMVNYEAGTPDTYDINTYPFDIEKIQSTMCFYSYVSQDGSTSQHLLSSTSSGYYGLILSLPKGYGYKIESLDNNSAVSFNNDNTKFKVNASLVTRTYDLVITISYSESTPDWGVNDVTNYVPTV